MSANPSCDPRLSGEAVRWHTWPMMRRESIAEHSWQVARVLLAIWPMCPRELLVHAIVHDLGETGPGDAPYPSKLNSPLLASEHRRLERETHESMVLPWSLPAPQELHPVWHNVFKLAEFMEMWEKSLQEMFMGNRLAQLPLERCTEGMRKHTSILLDLEETEICQRAMRYVERRRAEWTI